MLLAAACAQRGSGSSLTGIPTEQRKQEKAAVAEVLPEFALSLSVWPDLGKPGEDVMIKADVKPFIDGMGYPEFSVKTDPCGGILVPEGFLAAYKVPVSCEGGRIVVDAAFGGRTAQVSFHVSSERRDSGSLMLFPKDKDTVVVPLQISWDRTYARKENQFINIEVTRRGNRLLKLAGLDPDAELELDFPASPEPAQVRMCAGGMCQDAVLTVHRRRVFSDWSAGLKVDDFSKEGRNLVGGPARRIDEASFTRLIYGVIEAGDREARKPYLTVEYHRSPKGTPQGLFEALSASADREIDTRGYSRLSFWLRPGPLNRMPGPLKIELRTAKGETWSRRVVHRGDFWQEHSVDLKYFNARFGRAASIVVFVDEQATEVPAGTFCIASLFFVPKDAVLIEEASKLDLNDPLSQDRAEAAGDDYDVKTFFNDPEDDDSR